MVGGQDTLIHIVNIIDSKRLSRAETARVISTYGLPETGDRNQTTVAATDT